MPATWGYGDTAPEPGTMTGWGFLTARIGTIYAVDLETISVTQPGIMVSVAQPRLTISITQPTVTVTEKNKV